MRIASSAELLTTLSDSSTAGDAGIEAGLFAQVLQAVPEAVPDTPGTVPLASMTAETGDATATHASARPAKSTLQPPAVTPVLSPPFSRNTVTADAEGVVAESLPVLLPETVKAGETAVADVMKTTVAGECPARQSPHTQAAVGLAQSPSSAMTDTDAGNDVAPTPAASESAKPADQLHADAVLSAPAANCPTQLPVVPPATQAIVAASQMQQPAAQPHRSAGGTDDVTSSAGTDGAPGLLPVQPRSANHTYATLRRGTDEQPAIQTATRGETTSSPSSASLPLPQEPGQLATGMLAVAASMPESPVLSPAAAGSVATTVTTTVPASPDSQMPVVATDTRWTTHSQDLLLDSTFMMGSAAWCNATADTVRWLRDDDQQAAQLQLHPQELGRLDVTIDIRDGQARVDLVAGTAEARELLEKSLPALRDLLAKHGMTLGDGRVSQQQRQHTADTGQAHGHAPPADRDSDMPDLSLQPLYSRGRDMHRIDYYA